LSYVKREPWKAASLDVKHDHDLIGFRWSDRSRLAAGAGAYRLKAFPT
jgi:hypothetical protein